MQSSYACTKAAVSRKRSTSPPGNGQSRARSVATTVTHCSPSLAATASPTSWPWAVTAISTSRAPPAAKSGSLGSMCPGGNDEASTYYIARGLRQVVLPRRPDGLEALDRDTSEQRAIGEP